MTNGAPEITSEEEAREGMAAELGKAELEFVTLITAPIFWVICDASGPPRSGSAFFLDAGKGPFGVTAQHVIAGWRTDHCSSNIEALQISDLSIDFTGQNQIIDEHEELDIATFRIGAEEISKIGKAVLTGNQSEWPPPPPQKNKDVYFSGFPSTETCLIPPNEFLFGAAAGHGFVSSVNEKNVSSLIERDDGLIGVLGKGVPPEHYNFGGLSGGPMLTVIEHNGLLSLALAGVIYEGPNSSTDPTEGSIGMELIWARRAYFILPDGKLDRDRWENLSS